MHPPQETITVVTGLPRSGTSMLMRMLAAGGMPLLVDGARPADADNPHGYYEFAPVMRLKHGADWLPLARGKAVKIVSYLVPFLPPGETYRFIFLDRPAAEVAASQDRMLRKEPTPPSDGLLEILRLQDSRATAWITGHGHALLRVSFAEAHCAPARMAAQIAAFSDRPLDTVAMAAAVDRDLYRNKA